MVAAEWDRPGRLLTLRYVGHIRAADTGRVAADMLRTLAPAQPGFRLLTDLSALESMELDCAPDLEHMMDICNEKGVSLVVRIIPDPRKDIGLNIMSLFHYDERVRVVTCANLAEARSLVQREE